MIAVMEPLPKGMGMAMGKLPCPSFCAERWHQTIYIEHFPYEFPRATAYCPRVGSYSRSVRALHVHKGELRYASVLGGSEDNVHDD